MPALDEILTQAELSYLSDQRLGRLATLGPDGAPNVIPVGYRLLTPMPPPTHPSSAKGHSR